MSTTRSLREKLTNPGLISKLKQNSYIAENSGSCSWCEQNLFILFYVVWVARARVCI